MRVLAALDKFKGTATSGELGAAVVATAARHGASGRAIVLSDGGDGLLDVFGGPNRTASVTGPLGRRVVAPWRLDGERAVIECARASGLVLAGGRDGNDVLAATSAGTGELIAAAVAAGARHVLVGLGGSACTDGGLPALDALGAATLQALRDRTVDVVVCCDVTTRYEDAAARFGPQKGATAAQVAQLTARLTAARAALRERFGVEVGELPGAGAAGGLGGALAAAGAQLRPGFDVVAGHTALAAAVADADLVITGEGRHDRTSFEGKVVGGVLALGASAGTDVVVVAGSIDDTLDHTLDDTLDGDETASRAVSLVARFGHERALGDPLGCVAEVVSDLLS